MSAMMIVVILNAVTLFFIGLSLFYQARTRKAIKESWKLMHRTFDDPEEDDR